MEKGEYARKNLEELNSAGVDLWKDVKSEMGFAINDLETPYEKAVSKLGK